jgi:hypothetical protein
MPKGISVIGTDFHDQWLVDKPVDAVFCNPPYSEFEQWAARIIKESAAKIVYLVIPERWRESEVIKAVVGDSKVRSLGKFDFENADRKARAKVEVIRVNVERNKTAAFDAAIEEMLPELAKFDLQIDDEKTSKEKAEAEAARIGKEIAEGGSLIKSLVSAYEKEISHLYETYRSVVKINPVLMKELGVQKQDILDGVRSKIIGLKRRYWESLFSHLSDVTKRLATKQRKAFLESLQSKVSIEFTASNAYAMLIWVSKWASGHFDDQLIDLYKTLAQHANVENYKSNKKVLEKGHWRYLNEDESHYKIGYRLVIEGKGGINTSYDHYGVNGLKNEAHEFLSDFITVANNLGFKCDDRSVNYEWESRKKIELKLDDGELLMDVRAYMNGNLHIRVAKKVMLAINVQAGKLLGWIRSFDEAVDELDVKKADVEFAREMFDSASCRLDSNSLLRIGVPKCNLQNL